MRVNSIKKGTTASMKHLIDAYLRDYYPASDNAWIAIVRSRKTLEGQIEAATMCLNENGLMHPHQRRVGLERLTSYMNAMVASRNVDAIRRALRAKSFHYVYKLFKEETRNHYMVSSLTAYDVTQRLCAVYGIDPEFIYLHTGTTTGARILGINVRGREYLRVEEIPRWISWSLGAADIENFLCIYKNDFQPPKNNSSGARAARKSKC